MRNSRKTAFARTLRKAPTDAERKLWKGLRSKQIEGLRFRRQHPIGPYIVDFACLEARLVIELDGSQHAAQTEYDAKRTRFLNEAGFSVLRYWDDQVLREGEAVLEDIWRALSTRPHPGPPPRAGEGARAAPEG